MLNLIPVTLAYDHLSNKFHRRLLQTNFAYIWNSLNKLCQRAKLKQNERRGYHLSVKFSDGKNCVEKKRGSKFQGRGMLQIWVPREEFITNGEPAARSKCWQNKRKLCSNEMRWKGKDFEQMNIEMYFAWHFMPDFFLHSYTCSLFHFM